MYSLKNNAVEGRITTLGPEHALTPLPGNIGPSCTVYPRRRKNSVGAKYWSLSALQALPAGKPLRAPIAASSVLFLQGLKQAQAGNMVKPTCAARAGLLSSPLG